MATSLSPDELADIRRRMEIEATGDVRWTKPQINAALQELFKVLESPNVLNACRNAIESAAPGVFTATAKDSLIGIIELQLARHKGAI